MLGALFAGLALLGVGLARHFCADESERFFAEALGVRLLASALPSRLRPGATE